MTRTTVLCLVNHYLPGYKAGGPIRSISNLVDRLGDEFQFKIITRDRDFAETTPYTGVRANSWQPVGKAAVFYASPEQLSIRGWGRLLTRTEHDILYLNSFFSPVFTTQPLLLRKLRLLPGVSVIVAPRGEFSPGALALKTSKKRAYLAAAKATRLYSGVVWQATSSSEQVDIRQQIDPSGRQNLRIMLAPNLPAPAAQVDSKPERCRKQAGRLRVLYFSRISRKKNLDGALRMLAGVRGEVQLNIYGTLEDTPYWSECLRIIRSLPANVQAQYLGPVEPPLVPEVMKRHDLFFLPTLGENFGHVILEALSAGCPLLISDQTPWRNLEAKGVGWDLPLGSGEQFRAVLERCVDMRPEEHDQLSNAARRCAAAVIRDPTAVDQNRRLFRSSADRGGTRHVSNSSPS